MKLALLMLLGLVAITGGVFAQDAPSDLRPLASYDAAASEPLGRIVTVRLDDVDLAVIMREIGRQSGVNIVFQTDRLARERRRSIELENVTAASAILVALEGTDLQAHARSGRDVLILLSDSSEGAIAPSGLLQTVRGTVVDRVTKVPLPGANVVVLGTEPLLGTTTDDQGRFVLENVPLGRQDFRISYVGYHPAVVRAVLVGAGKEVVLNVELAEQVLQGAEVVVQPTADMKAPLNEMALASARSFSVEETRRYAGGLDDPARMASSFAGVATGAGIQENAIIVRGNAPKGVLWRLEGVEIPNPNHFEGLTVMGAGGLTIFSSHLLDNSDFLTSAFPAEYGNALAGIFDMQFRSGNPSTREHAIQLGLIGIDLASEGPFLLGSPSTYLFNYRYSTIGLLMPLLPTEDVARFQDLSFKLSFPTRRAGRFEAWGIGGLDAQSMGAERDSSKWEFETWDLFESDLHLGIGAVGVSHGIVLSPRSYLRSTAAVTANRTIFRRDRLNENVELEENLDMYSTTGRMSVGADLNHKFGTRHVNRTGFSAQRLFYDLHVAAALEDRPPLVSIAVGSGGATLLQAYSQSRFDVLPALSTNLGLHVQHFSLTGATSVEPRVGLQWRLGSGHSLSAGYGLHSQIEDLRIYFASQDGASPNRRLPMAKAQHLVAGYDWNLTANTRLKAEAYYQFLFDVGVIPDSSYSLINLEQDFLFDEVLSAAGAGRNYGLEITLERFLADGFYYLLTGSLFDSSYRGGDAQWHPTRWDRGFAVNALGGREIELGGPTKRLGVNVRLSGTGGKRRSPVHVPASLAMEEVVYDATAPFSVKEDALLLLDVTITFRRNRRSVSDVWALQVKNALAAKETVLDYSFRSERIEEVREGFPLPILSYKIEF